MHQPERTRGQIFARALLPSLVAAVLFPALLQAQEQEQQPSGTAKECVDVEGTPPGLYVTTDEGRTFLIKDDKTVELAPGDAAFADENKLHCINRVPDFLDWPCSTDAANARKFATYSIDEIDPGKNIITEVVRRYFEMPEVIEPIPDWIDGEISTRLNIDDIIPYSTPEYWYKPDPSVDVLHEKRPRTLLISLYVGINQVVIDNYQIDALRKLHSGEPIPVVFVFNDSNVVPVSYFGANVSLEELVRAFNERRIKIAEVPMWQLGDHHLSATKEEFEKLFDIPEPDQIDPLRREALAAHLETYGFSRKPIFVTILEGGKIYVDDADRVSVAISMGFDRLPTVVKFVEADDHLRRCGPGTPAGSSGVSGATTTVSGPIAPPGVPLPPPPPEPPASGS